jgi:ATP-dependent DNA ligase
MRVYLLSRASTGKFRFAVVECTEEWDEERHGYVIQRSYGQVYGKTTLSPAIVVDRTKQKRTWQEQYKLQFYSEVKKFKDKGYIEVPQHPNDYSESELKQLFGDTVTNTQGVIKPMLAKQFEKVTNQKIFDNVWLASRKLDGVRCLIYFDGKQVHTASRGGEHFDYSTEHIRTNEYLIEFLTNNPTIILDGELFKRFTSLQKISGAARMEKDSDTEWLEYWVYDMYDSAHPEMTAKERQDFLTENFPFFVVETEPDEMHINPIYLLKQVEVSGWKNIEALHDKYVSEGFEGVVIRNPNKPYKPNGRTNDMIKIKKYKDSEFMVIGYELGLRGSEDMTFVCELEDGRTFKAMPVGDRETKEEYVQNFETKYKGHKAECTYFNLSDDGVPTQPKLRVFRFDLE